MVPVGETQLAHLDKSHVTVHTYPEYHPETCLATFRVDIDVATCGAITPLSTLDYLISSFDSDIITMDYRVRGFTRDVNGHKLFLDHNITSIQDYIAPDTLAPVSYTHLDVYKRQVHPCSSNHPMTGTVADSPHRRTFAVLFQCFFTLFKIFTHRKSCRNHDLFLAAQCMDCLLYTSRCV